MRLIPAGRGFQCSRQVTRECQRKARYKTLLRRSCRVSSRTRRARPGCRRRLACAASLRSCAVSTARKEPPPTYSSPASHALVRQTTATSTSTMNRPSCASSATSSATTRTMQRTFTARVARCSCATWWGRMMGGRREPFNASSLRQHNNCYPTKWIGGG